MAEHFLPGWRWNGVLDAVLTELTPNDVIYVADQNVQLFTAIAVQRRGRRSRGVRVVYDPEKVAEQMQKGSR